MSVEYETALMMAVPVGLVGILWLLFVAYPARVGMWNYFKHCTYDEESFDDMWSGFKTNYSHNVKVMALSTLKQLLWALVFIIPGIMKVYSYYFVPYLLSDYPDCDADEIFAMSEKMTNGMRFEIFALDLSFFLWELLVDFTSFITLGFGGVLLDPYIQQTRAQLYHWAKANRLEEHTDEFVDVEVETVLENETL